MIRSMASSQSGAVRWFLGAMVDPGDGCILGSDER